MTEPDPMDRKAELARSWDWNAANWTRAIRDGLIASRKAGTDAAILDAIAAREPRWFLDAGCGEGFHVRRVRDLCGCEAAGFDVLLVETVGVGQSETTVRSMVDFFLLVMIAGAGDELQGIKKGIMELADALLVNKADGDNKPRANAAKLEYNRALHYLAPATDGWQTRAYSCSSLTGQGIPEMWAVVEDFRKKTMDSGVLEKRRRAQTLDWVYSMVEEHLRTSFFRHTGVERIRAEIEHDVMWGRVPPTVAAQRLIREFEGNG